MDQTISVTPARSGSSRTDVHIEMDTVYPRDQPPPYSELDVRAQPHTIIRETIIIQPPLKNDPMYYPCPKCYKRVLTKVHQKYPKKTHMLAGFIFGFTCWCCLCCLAFIPYLIPSYKKAEHYCPECNTFLGDYSR